MGVIPNGADGVNATGWPAILSAAGHSATSVADLKSLDQPTVEDLFKEKFIGTRGSGLSVFTSPDGPLAAVFGGLPNIPGASLPLLIIAAIAGRLLGVDPATLIDGETNTVKVTGVILALEKVPLLGDLVEVITGIEDGDLNDLGTWARTILQKLVDALATGLTGSITQGLEIAAIPLAILGQIASAPAHVLELLFGQVAGLQAQMTALQNNPTGPSQTDDFSVVGITGWTAITGTLAVSTRGPYIQTPALMAAYAGTPSTARKPGTDKHGIQIVIDGKMKGSCRAWICGDTAMSNYAAVEVYSGFNGDSVRLLTGSSPTIVVPRKKVDFVASQLQNLNTFDIWYEPSTNTFHVLRNGQPIGLDWVDSGNVVTHGSSKRNVGVVSNCTNRPDDGYWGPGIRKVTFYDR
ncbi:hypothetical protein [Mycolicibacterium llatzerense]|uniref:hypothetical protein n=1 Tax=Mycolicibacterium llatzerense TaxID=280871 RepID=UPI0021B5DEBD|nr:hypothetical protein [Mycolicibacterium llatzerense]MCT7369470.1 hypothetical protein [Mycolicibacterium llatzerense]